jgi:putative protease
MAEKIPIGKVTHYYPKIGVAVVELQETLKKGDKIEIEGKTTKFIQTVTSMQLNHVDIDVAEQGQSIGLKVEDRVREGDKVYKVIE